MAEPITIQKLTDASFDADTLGEWANEDKQVTSRLGLEYPSAPMASRVLVENGLLGATPFSTYIAMTASSLVNGDYAVVTNDSDAMKNGVYIKDSADFKLLSYSVQATAEKTLAAALTQVIYNTAGADVFAFTDKDGKVGVSFDKDANVKANNISVDDLGYALVIVDDNGNACLAIDKNGDLRSHTLTDFDNRIISLEEKSAGVVDNIDRIKNQKTDYMHIFSYGQSLSRGTRSIPLISTTQPYKNVTFTSGVAKRVIDAGYDFSGFKPLVEELIGGSSGETPTSALANKLVTYQVEDGGDADKWVFIGSAPGEGGRPITSLNKGSACYSGMMAQVQAAYVIAQSEGKSYSVWLFAWTQGENDYSLSTTQKQYAELLNSLHDDFCDDVRAITNQPFNPPMVMYQTVAHRQYGYDDMQIALAQLQVSHERNNAILATPIYHLPHASDDLHLTNDSSYQLGLYYAKAVNYTLYNKDKWRALEPVSIVAQGKVIDIDFSRGGLTLDTTLVSQTHNYGFDILVDNVLDDCITTVTISDTNRVRIVLSKDLPNGAVLSYAKGRVGDPNVSGNLEGPRGNLRDNAGDNDNYQDSTGTTRYMHNWCVMFEKSI